MKLKLYSTPNIKINLRYSIIQNAQAKVIMVLKANKGDYLGKMGRQIFSQTGYNKQLLQGNKMNNLENINCSHNEMPLKLLNLKK